MENDGVLCAKIVCFYKRRDGSTLPSTQATVVLLDPERGNVMAVRKTVLIFKSSLNSFREVMFPVSNLQVMDGEVITGMRTAAVSAISAKAQFTFCFKPLFTGSVVELLHRCSYIVSVSVCFCHAAANAL